MSQGRESNWLWIADKLSRTGTWNWSVGLLLKLWSCDQREEFGGSGGGPDWSNVNKEWE